MSDQPQEPRDILEGEMSDMARGDDTAQLAKEIIAMRRLHDFNRRLQLATDLQTALEEVLGASIALLSADKGNIQLYDPAAGSLRIVVHRGFDKEFLEAFTCVDASDPTACGRALKARKRIVIEDVEMDPLYEPYRKVAASAGYRGVQSTPFFDPTGEPLGILSTHFHKPHRPADYELRILDLYTRFAANYLERARAGEALRASEERFRMLADNISQLAWMADEKGWIFWYNKRWYEYTGSTLE
ncbi:MAG TPA: GAF domain-containing protein, partial [Terriglobales bacterium]|nr:GAF domain-containing protein [Terriglobales bacterium]